LLALQKRTEHKKLSCDGLRKAGTAETSALKSLEVHGF